MIYARVRLRISMIFIIDTRSFLHISLFFPHDTLEITTVHFVLFKLMRLATPPSSGASFVNCHCNKSSKLNQRDTHQIQGRRGRLLHSYRHANMGFLEFYFDVLGIRVNRILYDTCANQNPLTSRITNQET